MVAEAGFRLARCLENRRNRLAETRQVFRAFDPNRTRRRLEKRRALGHPHTPPAQKSAADTINAFDIFLDTAKVPFPIYPFNSTSDIIRIRC